MLEKRLSANAKQRNKPIGVFDSGIGGLSVMQELYKLLPQENYVFFADQHNVPYGEKTKNELVTLTSRIVKFLLEHNSKMVVVACNTATCYALDELRASHGIPIIGVAPAIKVAAEQTKTGNIGLIATPATAKSSYVTELIEKFAAGKNVFRVGCFDLENTVEKGELDSPETSLILNAYILPLKEKNIDQLVLGCTHYPFLRKHISALLGPGIALVDSGRAVAQRVETLLREQGLKGSSGMSSSKFFTNKDAGDFSRVASRLLGRAIQAGYKAL